MTRTVPGTGPETDVEFVAIMRRVRQLDPDAGETAVRGYLAEIREAESALAAVGADERDLPVAFSPRPPEGSPQ